MVAKRFLFPSTETANDDRWFEIDAEVAGRGCVSVVLLPGHDLGRVLQRRNLSFIRVEQAGLACGRRTEASDDFDKIITGVPQSVQLRLESKGAWRDRVNLSRGGGYRVELHGSSQFMSVHDLEKHTVGDGIAEHPQLIAKPNEVIVSLANQTPVHPIPKKVPKYSKWVHWNRPVVEHELTDRIAAVEEPL